MTEDEVRSSLRVLSIGAQSIELENQNGPIFRVALSFVVAPLFPGPNAVQAQTLHLTFDRAQLEVLSQATGLLAKQLPESDRAEPEAPPRSLQ